ncbi:MAG: hypothetical protein ABIG93_02200 [archaeon]
MGCFIKKILVSLAIIFMFVLIITVLTKVEIPELFSPSITGSAVDVVSHCMEHCDEICSNDEDCLKECMINDCG